MSVSEVLIADPLSIVKYCIVSSTIYVDGVSGLVSSGVVRRVVTVLSYSLELYYTV